MSVELTKQARELGLLGAAVLVILGLWPLIRGGEVHYWALVSALVLFVTAVAAPRVLHPLLKGWLALGSLLHRVATPLMMAMIFFGVFTPLGLLMRALGKTPLRLRRDPTVQSYWVVREQPLPHPIP